MESSALKVTIGFIWRLVAWTVSLSIILGLVLRIFLGFVIDSHSTSVFNVEGYIRYYRIAIILTILIDVIICFLSCKYTTDEIIRKFDLVTNKNAIIRNIIFTIIVIAIGMVIYQIVMVKEATGTLEELRKTTESVTVHFTDENDISDIAKLSAFIEWTKGILIVSVLTHIATYIALIGFERMWLERV